MSQPLRPHLDGHIVVRIARLSQAKDSLPALDALLNARERERAARFRFEDDRGRFVLGRALVRQCLGHYLAQAPVSIELAYTDRDRPYFPHHEKIQFSISHTQDLVALALTAGAQVGIDVEAAKNQPDLFDVAERILSPADLAKFHALPADEKLPAFYRVWTRKEAYLKARGEGIAEGLPLISVSLGPEVISSVADTRSNAAGRWHLLTLPVPAGYAGTLACDEKTRHLDGAFVRLDQGEVVTNSPF